MENYIYLLIIVPIIFSVLFLISSNHKYQKILSIVLFILASGLSILLVLQGSQKVEVSGGVYSITETIILLCELFITLYLYYVSIKNKRWYVLGLTIILTFLSVYTTFFMGKNEMVFLNIDKLSMVMALIVNIVGTLIVLYSTSYMNQYEKHRGMNSRQKIYFFVICIFLSAMNGLIFCDSLSWVYFFWEITTLSSFVLISYNNDNEALNSGFRALFINLIGGICFLSGIILFKTMMNIDSFSQIIQQGRVSSTYIIPVFLLCIAGFTKSAQLPFQSWLLGAMVAPTPVSALLHSSTMVKAGVYLIVKLSPAYAGTTLGTAIAIYGGLTFLVCSAIAITQRNAKRVLAYSTIANLGLIISSAGMGSSLAISAALMLIIFHSISKALLFLCAGRIEHIIGSRDIEDMTGLIRKAPVLALLSAFGMLSMILPPFGVLITKWISIEASGSNPIVAIFLILGSAFTTAYYVKWVGTILAYPVNDLRPTSSFHFATYFPLGILSLGILATSILIVPIFNLFVSPEVTILLNVKNQLVGQGEKVYSQIGSYNGGLIYLFILATVIIFFFVKKLVLSPKIKRIYLCGENNGESNTSLKFKSGDGTYVKPVVANLYLHNVIDEDKLTLIGSILSVVLIIVVLVGGLL